MQTESRAAESAQPFRFAFVLLPKFSPLTLSCLVEPLRIANYCDGRSLYHWIYLSVDGADVRSASGYGVSTQPIHSVADDVDAVVVCGGWNSERYESPELMKWLRKLARGDAVIGAAEVGSYVLAKCGLLSGYAATIHWHCRSAFNEQFTGVDLRDQLFVIDRQRMTCAGGVACLDMMLHEIQGRHGASLAAEVADQVVYSSSRDAAQPQKELRPGEHTPVPQVLRRAIEFMEANLERPVRIPVLAKSLGLSQRKLERLFNRHYGCSAVAVYRKVRLQHARVLLTQTDMSVLDICVACGFASSSYFSKSYAEEFGMRPRDHRLAWPDSDLAAFWPGLSPAPGRSARQSRP